MRPLPPAIVAALATLLVTLPGCQTPSSRSPGPPPAAASPHKPNPTLAEVPLPALAGWNASLILDNAGVGIWTVEPFQIFPQTATPELVGLDDLGRAHICSGYSGKWTPTTVVADGKWLGGLAHADADPRIPGPETYTGSQQGNLYQIVSWPHGFLDYRLIAHIPGREIHTLLAGDIDAASPGPEIIVFTRPGGIFRVTPTGPHGTFETRSLGEYDGRVRQAIPLPTSPGSLPSFATVSHNGRLERLTLDAAGPRWETLHQAPMGMSRVALRPGSSPTHLTLYATLDDGRVLRLERTGDNPWTTEVIYNGPQGARGVVAGPFGESPETETVAIFGYSGRVELLTRTQSGWKPETLFTDLDKGHWLTAAELDGRNSTLEIVSSGYSGRMVLLSRPPGYGRPR